MSTRSLILALLTILGALSSRADVIERTYVGTLSNPLTSFADQPGGGPDPGTNPGLISRGGKYLVRVSYDTNDLILVPAAARNFSSLDMQVVQLTDDPAAPNATNTYELFLPSEGFGQILTQTGQDHFFIGAGFAPTAEIQFFSSCSNGASCDAAYRGFEFESNFIRNNSSTTPAAGGDVVFEQATANVNFGDDLVTNYIVNVLDGGLQGLELNGGHLDVLSESSSASGGQLAPGVFFGVAVPVIAEAGASPLVYSAATPVVTTDAGTEIVVETPAAIVPGQLRSAPSVIDAAMRQADNDLGAARSDREDFLTFSWTVNGGNLAANEPGTRLDRRVDTLSVGNPSIEPHGSRFFLDGTRVADDVNRSVSIEDSGLLTTLDTTSFTLQADEEITGFTDLDSVDVSYQNAAPMIDTALATPVAGDGLLFELEVSDADLAVNALGLADFELLTVELLHEGAPFAGLADLLATGSEIVDQPTLISLFGEGPSTLEVRVADRQLASTSSFVRVGIDFTVVPEPSTGILAAAGCLTLICFGRQKSAPPPVTQVTSLNLRAG